MMNCYIYIYIFVDVPIIILTCRTRSRQRWRLMFLRRSTGRLSSIDSSSTPRVATHLYWSYFRTLCFNSRGSCLWRIHSSVSVLLILHSSSRTVVDWRYVYWSQIRCKRHFRIFETETAYMLLWIFRECYSMAKLTCIFPISSPKSTSPRMAMMMAKFISQT